MSVAALLDCTTWNMTVVDHVLAIQAEAPMFSAASATTQSDAVLLPTMIKPLHLAMPSDPCLQLLTPEALLHILHIPTLSELLYVAALAGTGVIGLAACWHASVKAELPKLFLKPSLLTMNILKRIATIQRPYHPRPFCTHGHIETLAAALLRWPPALTYKRQCISLPDGGSISLDWAIDPTVGPTPVPSPADPPSVLPADVPILLLLPGRITGSQDPGLQHTAKLSLAYGFRVVVFNPRGSGSSPVTSPCLSSLSSTQDLCEAIRHVTAAYPDATLVAAGWSLGANLLIRYLGEAGASSAVRAGIALSTPFDLPACIDSVSSGLSHLVYDRHAVAGLKSVLHASSLLWTGGPGDAATALRASTVREFDAAVGACSFGMESVDSLYRELSCSAALRDVAVPLLLVAALDDPVVPASSIPADAIGANPRCVLLTTACGGHMGWLAGAPSLFRHTWADEVLVEFLQSAIVELANTKLHESLSVHAAALHGPAHAALAPPSAAPSPATHGAARAATATLSLDIPASRASAPLALITTRAQGRTASGARIEDSPRVLHGLMSSTPHRPHPHHASLPAMTLSPPTHNSSLLSPPPSRYFWDDAPSPFASPSPTAPHLGIRIPPLHTPPAPAPAPIPDPVFLNGHQPRHTSPARLPSHGSGTSLDNAFSQWDFIYDIVRSYPPAPLSPSPPTPSSSPPHGTAAATGPTPPSQHTHTPGAAPPAPCSPLTSDLCKAGVQQALASACEVAMSGIMAVDQPAIAATAGEGEDFDDDGSSSGSSSSSSQNGSTTSAAGAGDGAVCRSG